MAEKETPYSDKNEIIWRPTQELCLKILKQKANVF